MPETWRPLGDAHHPGQRTERLATSSRRSSAPGASVDAIDDPATAIDGIARYTALHAAAWHGNTSAADALLRLGANPRVRDGKYGATALAGPTSPASAPRAIASSRPTSTSSTPSPAARRRASRPSSTPIRRRWIGRWATTAARPDDAAVTPLAWAMERDKPEMVALLQARGARPRDEG